MRNCIATPATLIHPPAFPPATLRHVSVLDSSNVSGKGLCQEQKSKSGKCRKSMTTSTMEISDSHWALSFSATSEGAASSYKQPARGQTMVLHVDC